MKTFVGVLAGAIAGSVLTVVVTGMLNPQDGSTASSPDTEQPLYWVAPMDAGYRRDSPGKSPMGMDLVPVYAQEEDSASPGTLRINPEVINNLGVRTGKVLREAWHSEIRTVGYVSYDQDQLVHIHPRVSGWVETLYVKAAGNPVAANQPLYELYSPALVNAQEEFLLALKRKNQPLVDAARARLRALQMSESFIENLASKGVVTQTVTFRAGQSGVVDNLAIREGFYVQPGTTMMSIGTLDEVWVEAEIFERQAGQVANGLAVTMTLDYLPGRVWEGRVDYVYPALDAKLRTARVRLRFANPKGELRPNMFAQVIIHADSENDVLSVPREAVIRTGLENRLVLALGDGRFQSVAVRLGRIGEQRVEILEGVDSGQDVVTSAQFLIDSESSRRSDFERMNRDDLTRSALENSTTAPAVNEASDND